MDLHGHGLQGSPHCHVAQPPEKPDLNPIMAAACMCFLWTAVTQETACCWPLSTPILYGSIFCASHGNWNFTPALGTLKGLKVLVFEKIHHKIAFDNRNTLISSPSSQFNFWDIDLGREVADLDSAALGLMKLIFFLQNEAPFNDK